MGLCTSKPRTGRSGYPGNFSSSSHASRCSEEQGYRSQNRNHGAAAAGQLGTKPRQQHQHPEQRQQKQQYQQKQQQQRQQVLTQRNKDTKECFVCGHEGHNGLRCNHRKMTCHICNKAGHLASVCKEKQHHPESIYKPKPNQPNKATQRNTKSKPKS